MELNVKQRVVLLGTLAGMTSNATELRILRELREALSFTEEEHALYGIRTETTGDGRELMFWESGAGTKEVEIGDVARRIIVRQLKALNEQNALADDHLDILDLFPEVEEGR